MSGGRLASPAVTNLPDPMPLSRVKDRELGVGRPFADALHKPEVPAPIKDELKWMMPDEPSKRVGCHALRKSRAEGTVTGWLGLDNSS